MRLLMMRQGTCVHTYYICTFIYWLLFTLLVPSYYLIFIRTFNIYIRNISEQFASKCEIVLIELKIVSENVGIWDFFVQINQSSGSPFTYPPAPARLSGLPPDP